MIWPPQCTTCDGSTTDSVTLTEDVDDMGLECNYEVDCTPLYKQIEQEEWESVANFLDTGYWLGSFFVDKMTPARQVRTWVTRFDNGDETRVKWSQLPLHLAIVMDAPLGVVRRLLDHYPKAIRCTDDEHQLPLHLAMRMGADDDVVDFLLQKFPEAVKARGKNGRSAIECALRSRKKARARILTAFLAQRSSHDGKDLTAIKGELDEKESAIGSLTSKLHAAEKARTVIEMDMKERIKQLTVDKDDLESKVEELKVNLTVIEENSARMVDEYQTSKFVDELDAQKKIRNLETSARELELAEKQVREEEALLRDNLERIELTAVRSMDAEDLKKLKEEIESLKTYRLKTARAKTMAEMEALKSTLEQYLVQSEGKTKEEIRSMQAAIKEYEAMTSSATTEAEVAKIKGDLHEMREELRFKRDISYTKSELISLKKNLNAELQFARGEEDVELSQLKTSIDALQVSTLDNKSPKGLLETKKEIAILKKKMQERTLTAQVQRDLDDISRRTKDQLAIVNDYGRKKELQRIAASVGSIKKKGLNHHTNEELVDLKLKMVALKDDLKEKELAQKLKHDAGLLKKDIEVAIRQADGKTKKELIALKKPVELIERSKYHETNQKSLLEIQRRFKTLSKEIVTRDEAVKTKDELALMKRMLMQQIRENDVNTRKGLEKMKKKIEELQALKLDQLTRPELEEAKAELPILWKQMAETEEVLKTKDELASLKVQLDQDISRSSGTTKRELLVVKHAIADIDLDNVEVKNQAEWRALKKELESVKLDLKKKELRALKRTLDHEIKNPGSRTPTEMSEIKSAANEINIFSLETATYSELNSLKTKIDSRLRRSTAFAKTKKRRGIRSFFGLGKAPTSPRDSETKVLTLLPPRVTHASVAESSDEEEECNASNPKNTTTKSYGEVVKTVGPATKPHQPLVCAQ